MIFHYGIYTPALLSLITASCSIVMPGCLPPLPFPPVLGIVFTVLCSTILFGNNWDLVEGWQKVVIFVTLLLIFIFVLLNLASASCGFFIFLMHSIHFSASVLLALILTHASAVGWSRNLKFSTFFETFHRAFWMYIIVMCLTVFILCHLKSYAVTCSSNANNSTSMHLLLQLSSDREAVNCKSCEYVYLSYFFYVAYVGWFVWKVG